MKEEQATGTIKDLEHEKMGNVAQSILNRVKYKIPIEYRSGSPLYRLGDKGTGYVVLVHDNKVEYFVRYRQARNSGLKFGRQVLVWRNPEGRSMAAAGIARHVFFNILLPEYKALITDNEQTKFGMHFWVNAAAYALGVGKFLFFVDRRGHTPEILQVEDEQDLEELKPAIWGTSTKHKLTWLAISTLPLVLK